MAWPPPEEADDQPDKQRRAHRIRREICDIASRSRSVRSGEIERIVDQLEKLGLTVERKFQTHGLFFRIGTERFSVCVHNRGSSEIKACYVRDFLEAMANLGFYEE